MIVSRSINLVLCCKITSFIVTYI